MSDKKSGFEGLPFQDYVDQQDQLKQQDNFETEDGFSVHVDRKSDGRGLIVELHSGGGSTSFLVMNGQLFNAEVMRTGTADSSVSKKMDDQLLNAHGRRLLKLLADGAVKE